MPELIPITALKFSLYNFLKTSAVKLTGPVKEGFTHPAKNPSAPVILIPLLFKISVNLFKDLENGIIINFLKISRKLLKSCC